MLSGEQVRQVVEMAMELARTGQTRELLEFLDRGVPVDVKDAGGNTLLMLAAYHGQLDTVRALLGRGADVELRNDRDQSVIAGAIFKGEDGVVKELLAAGADLDAGTPSARQAAEMFGRTDLLG